MGQCKGHVTMLGFCPSQVPDCGVGNSSSSSTIPAHSSTLFTDAKDGMHGDRVNQ